MNEEKRQELINAIHSDIMWDLSDHNLGILSDALSEYLSKWTTDELIQEYKERATS